MSRNIFMAYNVGWTLAFHHGLSLANEIFSTAQRAGTTEHTKTSCHPSHLKARGVDEAVGTAHGAAHRVAVELPRRDQLAVAHAALHEHPEAVDAHHVRHLNRQPAHPAEPPNDHEESGRNRERQREVSPSGMFSDDNSMSKRDNREACRPCNKSGMKERVGQKGR